MPVRVRPNLQHDQCSSHTVIYRQLLTKTQCTQSTVIAIFVEETGQRECRCLWCFFRCSGATADRTIEVINHLSSPKLPFQLTQYTNIYNNRLTFTRLSTPTHAQLRHRLKVIKNPPKKLLHVSVYDHLQGVSMSSLKSLLFDHSWMYTKRGDVAACRVVCIGLYLKSVRVYVF